MAGLLAPATTNASDVRADRLLPGYCAIGSKSLEIILIGGTEKKKVPPTPRVLEIQRMLSWLQDLDMGDATPAPCTASPVAVFVT